MTAAKAAADRVARLHLLPIQIRHRLPVVKQLPRQADRKLLLPAEKLPPVRADRAAKLLLHPAVKRHLLRAERLLLNRQ